MNNILVVSRRFLKHLCEESPEQTRVKTGKEVSVDIRIHSYFKIRMEMLGDGNL